MHPEYLDYVQKQTVLPRARWFDVKQLCRSITDCPSDKLFVTRFVWGNEHGWLVDFTDDVDISEIKRCIYGVVKVGERSIYVSVRNYGESR